MRVEQETKQEPTAKQYLEIPSQTQIKREFIEHGLKLHPSVFDAIASRALKPTYPRSSTGARRG